MDTEGIAVHAVEGILFTCRRVRAYIDKNDRTPLTDGRIDVHSSEQLTNENLIGHVAVQVKGKSVDNGYKPRETEPYSLPRTILEGYLHSKGVLFFLVLINKKPSKTTVYYSPLTPLKIQYFLEQLPEGQATTTIHLKRFPTQPDEIKSTLTFALKAQEESPALGFDPSLFEVAKELTLYSDTKINLKRPLQLNHKDLNHSLVLRTTTGMSVPVPGLMTIYPAGYVERPTDLVFRSGDFSFKNPTVKQVDEERFEFKLSEGLSLGVPHPKTGAEGSINLSLKDSLGGRHEDIGFFLACLDNGSYSVDGNEFRFDAATLEPGGELRAHFDYLDRVCTLLRALDSDPYLVQFSEVSEHRSRQLDGLFEAIVEKKELVEDLEQPGRVLQPLGQWFLELICVKGESDGKWKYLSLFSPDLARQFFLVEAEDSPEPRIFRIMPYDIIDEERFAFTLNLNLERVVEAYAEIFDYPETSSRANHMVLRLIKAADTVESRRDEFLDAAERLNEWLIGKEGDVSHHLINRWQTLARRHQLSDSDCKDIRALRRTCLSAGVKWPKQVAFCCSVLLRDFEEADDYFAALSDEERETIQEWPIWFLRTSGSELAISS